MTRSRVRAPTREVVLHRLRLSPRTDLEQAIRRPDPEIWTTDVTSVSVDGLPGLWISGSTSPGSPGWERDAAIVLGYPTGLTEQRAGGVLVVDVDGDFFAIPFGEGFRWIDDAYHDRRFGLRVAVRCLDPEDLRGLVRRRAGLGRTDSTVILAGAPVSWLRPGDVGAIVRQIAGRALDLGLTYKPPAGRGNVLQGSGSLRIRVGIAQTDLIHDLRRLIEIHQRPNPVPELSFVDDVMPVSDDDVATELFRELDRLLGPGGDPDGCLTLGVPDRALPQLEKVQSYDVKLRGITARREDVRLEDLTDEMALIPAEKPVARLLGGEIVLRRSSAPDGVLLRTRAFDWLEASLTIGDRHYALLEGEWFEFGHDYAHRVQAEVSEVFGHPGLSLPGWRPGWDEARYNKYVQRHDPRFTCFDRDLVRDSQLHRGQGLEVCDLLGPENELVHVKRASGSSVLSHLFEQGLVSYQSLLGIPETRSNFRRLAAAAGRDLDPGWNPSRVVFAIQLRSGRSLTPQTLFPFARASLARAAGELREQRVRVDVVGIPVETEADAA